MRVLKGRRIMSRSQSGGKDYQNNTRSHAPDAGKHAAEGPRLADQPENYVARHGATPYQGTHRESK